MSTYCGANCEGCPSKDSCKGCVETGGSPFGGRCVAAEYIKVGGLEAYQAFKQKLLDEVNGLLAAEGLGPVGGLVELVGYYVNLAYPLPSGERVKLLNDKNVYLGALIELPDLGVNCGVVADEGFILICRYGAGDGSPELIVYHRR